MQDKRSIVRRGTSRIKLALLAKPAPVETVEAELPHRNMSIGLIGINIYAKFLNFACDLHVLAFQEFLVQRGYPVKVLDYKPVYFGDFDMRHPQDSVNSKYARALERAAKSSAKDANLDSEVAKWKLLSEGYESVRTEREVRYDKFKKFADEHLHLTQQKYDSDSLEILDPGLDAYICVTDVIWQSLNRHQFDRGFLLGSRAFEGKPKIAYAASRGASKDYSNEDREQFLNYLGDIDHVSVREADFEDYIGQISSRTDLMTVVDPVMLHDIEFWDRFVVPPREQNFILLYYVMERAADTVRMAVEYAKANGLVIIEVSDRPMKDGLVADPDVVSISRYDVGMEEWLGYIKYAEAVFTNSFHGCCFSVIFEKKVFAGERNGSKVPNFLTTFGLEAQRFNRHTLLSELSHEIDFDDVKKRWAMEKAHAESFILRALEESEAKVEAARIIDHSPFDKKRKQIKYRVLFHSGNPKFEATLIGAAAHRDFEAKPTLRGSLQGEYVGATFLNDGESVILESPFEAGVNRLTGWHARFRIDNHWFWLMNDGTIEAKATPPKRRKGTKQLLEPGSTLPYIPVNKIGLVVLEAQWEATTPLDG